GCQSLFSIAGIFEKAIESRHEDGVRNLGFTWLWRLLNGLAGIGDESYTGFLVEFILARVDLPTQQWRIGLLEEPCFVVADQYGGVAAIEHLIIAIEGIGERRVVIQINATRIFNHGVDGVRHLATVGIPERNRAEAGDRERQPVQEPVRLINLMATLFS